MMGNVMQRFDKKAVLQVLVERMNQEVARAKAHALDAAEGATHEDNRAEGDKDMRSTEASYIARGHAQRTAQLEQALVRLSHLDVVELESTDEIRSTALVELEHNGKRSIYFLLPVAGGEQIVVDGTNIQSLTLTSPLGSALLGQTVGDQVELESPQGVRVYEVVDVR
jgi:transcription elongation GreA/GreB family factor